MTGICFFLILESIRRWCESKLSVGGIGHELLKSPKGASKLEKKNIIKKVAFAPFRGVYIDTYMSIL